MTKCVIFDLDGVITETSVQHFEAWKIIASELDIEIDWQFNELLKGVSRMESLKRILEYGDQVERFSNEEMVCIANRKNEIYVDLIKAFDASHLFNGVRALFEYLSKSKVKVAIGSASLNAPFLIHAMGLDELTDYIVNPLDVTSGKPAPDIFLKAMNYFNLSPEDCIGVEDSEAGIAAIKAAGMYAVGIGDSMILSQADIVYQSTEAFVTKVLKEGI